MNADFLPLSIWLNGYSRTNCAKEGIVLALWYIMEKIRLLIETF